MIPNNIHVKNTLDFSIVSLMQIFFSRNPGITRLPEELGLLESCKLFTTEGLDIVNVPKEIQEGEFKVVMINH